MEFGPFIAFGVIVVVLALVMLFMPSGEQPPHKDVRIVQIQRSTGERFNHEWMPIAYLGILREEIQNLREADSATYKYSLEYRNYPDDAVQCDDCGGRGCETCDGQGWLPRGHPKGRKCYREACENYLPPRHIAVYCSNECAFADAGGPVPAEDGA